MHKSLTEMFCSKVSSSTVSGMLMLVYKLYKNKQNIFTLLCIVLLLLMVKFFKHMRNANFVVTNPFIIVNNVLPLYCTYICTFCYTVNTCLIKRVGFNQFSFFISPLQCIGLGLPILCKKFPFYIQLAVGLGLG